MEFVNISVSTSELYVTTTRDYGTVAVIGDGATAGTDPIRIGSVSEASTALGTSTLYSGVKAALINGAASVWAVNCGTPTLISVAAALAKIEGYDIQVVALAGIIETTDNAYISTTLSNHVVASSTGRIGVFQLAYDSVNHVGENATTMPTAITGMLAADKSRMVGIAHNSTSEVACSVAGLISSLKPWQSPMLKPISGVVQTVGFTNAQIEALQTAQINVIVDPLYLSGTNCVLNGDYTCGSAANGMNYIDTRRVVDDISYKLKSKLTDPNIIGEVRINKSGLSVLMNHLAGLLQTCVNDEEIDSYVINLPVLNALSKDESSRSTAETALITTARTSRAVSGQISIEYAGVLHTINLSVNITA